MDISNIIPGIFKRGDGQQEKVVRHPMVADTENWPPLLKDDFIKFFCGEKIGEGTARWVYALRYNPELVVKVEFTENTFQNQQEWVAWSAVQFTPFGGLLAPCRRISPCGHILIQERTQALREGQVPSKTPNFVSDRKLKNYGFIDGRGVVCHDYAINDLMGIGIKNAELDDIPKSFWS